MFYLSPMSPDMTYVGNMFERIYSNVQIKTQKALPIITDENETKNLSYNF